MLSTSAILAGLLALASPGAAASLPVAPPLDVVGLSGQAHSLGKWQGRVVVISYWAT